MGLNVSLWFRVRVIWSVLKIKWDLQNLANCFAPSLSCTVLSQLFLKSRSCLLCKETPLGIATQEWPCLYPGQRLLHFSQFSSSLKRSFARTSTVLSYVVYTLWWHNNNPLTPATIRSTVIYSHFCNSLLWSLLYDGTFCEATSCIHRTEMWLLSFNCTELDSSQSIRLYVWNRLIVLVELRMIYACSGNWTKKKSLKWQEMEGEKW